MVCATNRPQCCSSEDISQWITAAQIDLVSGLQMQFAHKARVFDTLINDIIKCEWKSIVTLVTYARRMYGKCIMKSITHPIPILTMHCSPYWSFMLEYCLHEISIMSKYYTRDAAIALTQLTKHPCMQAELV